MNIDRESLRLIRELHSLGSLAVLAAAVDVSRGNLLSAGHSKATTDGSKIVHRSRQVLEGSHEANVQGTRSLSKSNFVLSEMFQ